MPDIDPDLTHQREQEYINFIAIYRAHPELMNPPMPSAGEIRREHCDAGEWVNALYDAVYQSPYIKRLEAVRLAQLFEDLERQLSVPTKGYDFIDDFLPENLRIVSRRRRELRFLRRYAGIIKYAGYRFSVPNPAKMRLARKRMAKTCRVLEQRLEILMEDEFLIEGLGQHSLIECRRLSDTMWRMAELFETILPSYPYERETDPEGSIAKVMVHWFATCCFRTYDVCAPANVLQMFSASWLRPYLDHLPAGVPDLIFRAEQRNRGNFHRRVAEQPWDIEVRADYWEPPTAL